MSVPGHKPWSAAGCDVAGSEARERASSGRRLPGMTNVPYFNFEVKGRRFRISDVEMEMKTQTTGSSHAGQAFDRTRRMAVREA